MHVDIVINFWQKQVLTDAGQYVIRFGHADPISKSGAAEMVTT